MKLWTYHPLTFRLNDPNGKIDPTKGMCWGNSSLRYGQALPRLHELLGTDQFLCLLLRLRHFTRAHRAQDLHVFFQHLHRS